MVATLSDLDLRPGHVCRTKSATDRLNGGLVLPTSGESVRLAQALASQGVSAVT